VQTLPSEARSNALSPPSTTKYRTVLRPNDGKQAAITLLVSAAVTGLAVAVKLLLLAVTMANGGFVIYVPAVAVAAWYRGFLGGVLATLLGAVVDLLVFAVPLNVAVVDIPAIELRLGAYIAGGIAVSFLSHRLRDERDRALVESAERSRALEEAAVAREEVERVNAMERRASELRDAFNSLISHELRTPITAIYGGAKLLASRERDLDEKTRRELIDDLEAEADRLYRLVEDLLILAKSERGTVDRLNQPLLLSRIVARVVRSEHERWPGAKFDVQADSTVSTTRGDETYVEQVLRNLLSNAAKYSPTGSTIHVIVDETAEGVRVRVIDEGPGFEAEEATKLFELYYRSPSTAGTVSGAGIGLYVCRVLVEAMGGRIWATPRPEGGAEFGFVLQRDDEDIVDEDVPPVPTSQNGNRLRTGATAATAD
jgi:K+-sensing histidine kinase KdpD